MTRRPKSTPCAEDEEDEPVVLPREGRRDAVERLAHDDGRVALALCLCDDSLEPFAELLVFQAMVFWQS